MIPEGGTESTYFIEVSFLSWTGAEGHEGACFDVKTTNYSELLTWDCWKPVCPLTLPQPSRQEVSWMKDEAWTRLFCFFYAHMKPSSNQLTNYSLQTRSSKNSVLTRSNHIPHAVLFCDLNCCSISVNFSLLHFFITDALWLVLLSQRTHPLFSGPKTYTWKCYEVIVH